MSESKDGRYKSNDDMMSWVTLGIFVLILGAVLWYFCRYPILILLLGPAWIEFKLADMVGLNTLPVEKWLNWLDAVFDGRVKAKSITFQGIDLCLTHAANYSALLFAAGFLVLVIWSFMKSEPKGFSRDFSLGGYVYGEVATINGRPAPQWFAGSFLIPMARSKLLRGMAKSLKIEVKKGRISAGPNFIAEMSREWRQVSCVIDFDPTDCIPALSDGLSPEYWAAYAGIITMKDANRLAYRRPNEDLGVIEWNVERAKAALVGQVEKGGEWLGVAKAPPYVQAACLIAIMNHTVNNPELAKLVGECSDAARPLFSLRNSTVTAAIAAERVKAIKALAGIVARRLTPKNIETIDNLAKGHQYTRSATIAVVAKCGPNMDWGGGSFGVLQSSLFLWLKPIDRTLFFCCQNVGAPTYQPEAAGPIAHFQAEALAAELGMKPPSIWVDGPLRWLEGYIERFEDGPYDGDISPFTDVSEPQPGVDY